jgi:hypothetical protein
MHGLFCCAGDVALNVKRIFFPFQKNKESFVFCSFVRFFIENY